MGETPHGRTLGIVTILCTLLGWSSIPLFLRFFSKEIDPWTANGWRYGVSAVIWLPPLLIAWARGSLPKGVWRAALWPSIWNIPAQVCFGLAPYFVEPGLMTFSLRVNIVFVTLGAALLFAAERRVIRSPGFLAGLVMVGVGAAATVALKPGGLGGGTLLGVLLAIGSGALYAGYALSVRRTMMGLNPLLAFAAVNQLTGLGLVACMLFLGDRHGAHVLDLARAEIATGFSDWTPQAHKFSMLVLSAIIGIGLGHTFYFLSIARLGLATASAVVQLQPIMVSVASYFLFREVLTPAQWLMGLVAVTGAGLILWTQHRLMRPAPTPESRPEPRPAAANAG
ncbi:MAG: DMT family transporter [Phycisphaerales bacterium]|nr:DMT family transporter [Phycisphaerales bacterium]